ncbi:MAG: alanine--tRNA ligase, partial [Firmicutes bacterium]|nr:alanine--tRNA ligase [Bacillota bacterium]
DNFWEHGTGPCGPCSEIYYDRGEEYGCGKPDCKVGCDCDRYMEFWNLVFTQFDRLDDGTYAPLEQKNIDTGMGLERLATIMQGVDSIFDVDTVKAIRDAVCKIAGVEYGKDHKTDVSVRVITDHIRSVTFMTSDGILPSNEGRGYVLRRLLRRAARHGKLLGINELFLAKLSEVVIENSKDAYPALGEKQDYIFKLLTVEETSFYKTIDKGMEILRADIAEMKKKGETVLSGEKSFRLYDTYGFPTDLTQEILEEEGFTLDEEAFAAEMKLQRERARNARGESTYMGADETIYHKLPTDLVTEYAGYDSFCESGRVIALVANDEVSTMALEGMNVAVFMDKSPFYAEGGGQVGDSGTIKTDRALVEITDCIKVVGGKTAHIGVVKEGVLEVGDIAEAAIDKKRRLAISRNHSTTHLLQKALRLVLGSHVEQAGSYVSEDRLRFDFTHFTALTPEELAEVEKKVNEEILAGLPITWEYTSMEEARKKGAMALFGEKYGDVVRLVSMGDFSRELCGGAHLENTAQAGSFKIISEGGIAAGVRRIEAVTGEGALAHYCEQEKKIKELAALLKTGPDNLINRLETIIKEEKELKQAVESFKARAAEESVSGILAGAKEIAGLKTVCAVAKDMDAEQLKTLGDMVKGKADVVLLATKAGEKVNFIAMATDEAVKRGVNAGAIVKAAAMATGGGGGGKPNMARAGGKDASKIPEALAAAEKVIKESLEK